MQNEHLVILANTNPTKCVAELFRLIGCKDIEAFYSETVVFVETYTEKITPLTVTPAQQIGGYEGSGSYMSITYSVKDINYPETTIFYFRITGVHDSWSDPIWDSAIEIVKPVEMTHIQYMPI